MPKNSLNDYEEYQDASDRRPYKRGLSMNSKWGIALVIELLIIIALIIGIGRTYVHSKYNKLQVNDLKQEDLHVNEGVNKKMNNYTNIALFGVDARDDSLGKGNRSDAIMIASINNSTKEVRIISVYRDTLLEITKNDGSTVTTKINAAYAYGGPELAVQTLNKNLDLNISEYVTVNWEGLTRAIDMLGGVTVHVEENELETLNGVLAEQISVNGIASDGVYTTGDVTLNGAQATAYSRIRSTDQGDITRTERQREVLSAMIAKAKQSDVGTLNKMIDEIFPYIGTSITEDQMYTLVTGLMQYQLGETQGFPFKFDAYNDSAKGACLAPVDLNENVKTLQLFLFDTADYQPTSNVQRISAEISSETGYSSAGPIPVPEKTEE